MTTMLNPTAPAADTLLDRLWLCGDIHGEMTHLKRALQREPVAPTAILFLGDMDPPEPIGPWIEHAIGQEMPYWWIHGNHETDNENWFENAFEAPGMERNISGKVIEFQGLRIGGLGGVFREEVWMPPREPVFRNFDDYEQRLPRHLNPYADAKLRTHHSTIFPDEYEALAEQNADVLLIHDAPSCHRYGNAAYDLLAQVMGVRWVAHGHHHDALDYSAFTENLGFQTIGVGKRGITTLAGRCVLDGELDAVRRG